MSDVLIKIEIYKLYDKCIRDIMVEKRYMYNDKYIRSEVDIDLSYIIEMLKKDGCIIELRHIRICNIYNLYIDIHEVLENSIYGGLYRINEDLFIDSICNFVLGCIKR